MQGTSRSWTQKATNPITGDTKQQNTNIVSRGLTLPIFLFLSKIHLELCPDGVYLCIEYAIGSHEISKGKASKVVLDPSYRIVAIWTPKACQLSLDTYSKALDPDGKKCDHELQIICDRL